MPVEVLPEMTLVMPKSKDLFGRIIMSSIEKFKRWADKNGWFLMNEKNIGNEVILKYILPDGVDKTIRLIKDNYAR